MPVFDSNRGSLSEAFDFRGAQEGESSADRPWVADAAGGLRLEAMGLEPGRESGLLRYHSDLRDSYYDSAGTIVEGKADTTTDKIERMRKAGISVAERIEEIPALIRERMAEAK